MSTLFESTENFKYLAIGQIFPNMASQEKNRKNYKKIWALGGQGKKKN